MKTSVAITRLIDAATRPNTSSVVLANAALQTIEKVLGSSKNGEEALLLLRNKFMRQGLDRLDQVTSSKSKRSVTTATAIKATTTPKRVMSEEAKLAISRAMTKRWKEKRQAKAAKASSKKNGNGVNNHPASPAKEQASV